MSHNTMTDDESAAELRTAFNALGVTLPGTAAEFREWFDSLPPIPDAVQLAKIWKAQ